MSDIFRRARRDLLRLTAAGAVGASIPAAVRAAVPTPSATEGPFYPTNAMRFADVDNDLVRIAGVVEQAGGEIVHLSGRVLTDDGKAIAGARVEIWQVDANARYLHTGERSDRPRDAAFQGFGHDITDVDGRYEFRTIKPVAYPGRTPHIHVKVITAERTLTTQFYIAAEAGNDDDVLYRRMTDAQKRSVEMRFGVVDDVEAAVVDIVL